MLARISRFLDISAAATRRFARRTADALRTRRYVALYLIKSDDCIRMTFFANGLINRATRHILFRPDIRRIRTALATLPRWASPEMYTSRRSHCCDSASVHVLLNVLISKVFFFSSVKNFAQSRRTIADVCGRRHLDFFQTPFKDTAQISLFHRRIDAFPQFGVPRDRRPRHIRFPVVGP